LIVVDASAVLDALAASPNSGARERIRADGDLRAPHLIDLEVLNALRHLLLRGKVTVDAVSAIRSAYSDMPMTRYPHLLLADRIWDLRNTISAYDAAYVTLAEALSAPLVTCDARLARAAQSFARVEQMRA
jgi:predicted nucleic acid-binding protein